MNLDHRLAAVGRDLALRESDHAEALASARQQIDVLHARTSKALEAYHSAVASVPSLSISLGDIRLDDKHLRAWEFDLRRGRHRVIVVAKSRGDVTLVGPFHMGKTEGPCQSFPFEATTELETGLGDLLEAFLLDAASP